MVKIFREIGFSNVIHDATVPQLFAQKCPSVADKTDFKYATVRSMEEICMEVNQAATFGDLAAIVIDAHGTPLKGLLLAIAPQGTEERLTITSNFQCFSKLKKNGAIVLSGGSVGQDGLRVDNLAQKIANIAQRTVLAPTCHIYPSYISVSSIDPLILSHPAHSSFNSW